MANIVISRIQHRRGRRENLPQPLLPAEVALTSDTSQVWIGQDPALAVPSINVYTDKLVATAQDIVDVNIVETRFDENMTVTIFNTLVAELKVAGGVTLVDDDILWDNTYRGAIETITVDSVGSNYQDGDAVTAVSATGSAFVGTLNTTGGNIDSVTITNGGINYRSANTTFILPTAGGRTGGVLSVAVTDIYGSTVHIAADPTIDAGNNIANIDTTIDGLSATITNRLMGDTPPNNAAFGGTFVSNSLIVDNHTEAANVALLINRVNSTTPGEITGIAFTNLNIEITGISGAGLGAISDVDLTGAADNDMLYRSGGIWIDTAGALTWNGSTLVLNEITDAPGDVDNKGQIWVRDDAPNVLMFTDDNGTDQSLDPSVSDINVQNGDYTLVLSDKGKTISKESGGIGETFTIPANSSVAYKIGTFVAFNNDGGDDLTIAITTDTLIWADDNTTGSRTLADGGYAVAQKVATTTWKIAGKQLS